MRTKIISVMTALLLCVGVFTTGACAYVEGDINSGAEASEDTSIVAESEEQEVSAEVTDSESDTSADADDESEETTTLTGTVNVNDYLNLRTGASTNDEVIGHLLPGTTVEIIGEEDGWYQVIVSEQTGYVCGDYLEVAESVTQTAESTTEETTSADEDTLLALYESLLQSTDSSSSLSLTPEGNLTLVDNITDAASGKQFITVCTKSGNYFYLIIDEDDEGESTVHFLNQVDEADLLALMDEEDAAEYEASISDAETEEIEDADTSEADTSTLKDEEPKEAEKKSGGVNLLPVVLLVAVLAAGGGFFAYTQVMNKKKEETRPDPDADYTGADDELELPEDDFYSEDEADTDGGFFDDEPV
ncbi:MAG: DUF4366 domain-containing protein [Clostridiales bacterium]|nr:DUF4366 domain-containing protein [Clostridiales bacterium]